MKKGNISIFYDDTLHIEACLYEGKVQPFPNHFHQYYVIGYMKGGNRALHCCDQDYLLKKEDIVVFNPMDPHSCQHYGPDPLDYHSFNIEQEIMLNLAEEVSGRRELPYFSQNVFQDEEVLCYARQLHDIILDQSEEFEKEEMVLLLVDVMIQKYAKPFASAIPECEEHIEKTCEFMQKHYSEPICLEDLCAIAHLSKSSLLRAFTKTKGVTPYRYLETVRINEAKRLLEKGVAPMEVALQTGFSDQSHFTKYFSSFIGLSPGVYRDIFSKGEADE